MFSIIVDLHHFFLFQKRKETKTVNIFIVTEMNKTQYSRNCFIGLQIIKFLVFEVFFKFNFLDYRTHLILMELKFTYTVAISGFHPPKTSDSKIFKTKDLYHFCISQELSAAFYFNTLLF